MFNVVTCPLIYLPSITFSGKLDGIIHLELLYFQSCADDSGERNLPTHWKNDRSLIKMNNTELENSIMVQYGQFIIILIDLNVNI